MDIGSLLLTGLLGGLAYEALRLLGLPSQAKVWSVLQRPRVWGMMVLFFVLDAVGAALLLNQHKSGVIASVVGFAIHAALNRSIVLIRRRRRSLVSTKTTEDPGAPSANDAGSKRGPAFGKEVDHLLEEWLEG